MTIAAVVEAAAWDELFWMLQCDISPGSHGKQKDGNP